MSGWRTLFFLVVLGLGGCSAIVEFDRSRLVDAGSDAGADSGITDEEEDAGAETVGPD